MKTLRQACTPRASVFDSTKRDTVPDILDLAKGKIDPAEFFAENYATQGMRTLLSEAFKRLDGGAQAQGIFRLSQSMGGGKTHNLIALGLLAAHPEWREKVMASFYTPKKSLGPVRVAAFSGRQTDSPFGIWGEIAKQLGVAVSTVRSQIGSMRLKTAADSIRDLVRQVAVLPPVKGALRHNGASRPALASQFMTQSMSTA